MSDAEFRGTTPRRFHRLVGRWKDDQMRRDRRSGEVVAMLYNVHRDTAKTSPVTWLDVFPHHRMDAPAMSDDDTAFRAFQAWALTRNALIKIGAA